MYLQLHQCKTSSSSSATVVFDGRTSNNRPEFIDWSWGNPSGLGETGSSTARFSTWLVEMNAYTALPILVEVRGVDCGVVLDRLCKEDQSQSLLPLFPAARDHRERLHGER